jgi:hypothetical protein
MVTTGVARFLQGRVGLGRVSIGERDARTTSWRGFFRGGALAVVLTKIVVTIWLAWPGGMMGSLGARGIDTRCLLESRERVWTWLGAQGCSSRAVGQDLCH